MPPVLEKPMYGTGQTSEGRRIKPGPWTPDGTPFAKDSDAVKSALTSPAGQPLDPQSYSGASLVSAEVEGTHTSSTMVLLCDGYGDLSDVFYYFHETWYHAELQAMASVCSAIFDGGLKGSIVLMENAG